MKTPISESALRTAYEKTALARMGVPIERAMQIEAVRVAVEWSARASADNNGTCHHDGKPCNEPRTTGQPFQVCAINGLLHGIAVCRHHEGGERNACHYNYRCEHQVHNA